MQDQMNSFEIKDDFYLNGEKFKIISGAIHYFRVVPEYWKDRLEKLKALGCNTVETYVAWNVHEQKEGEFNFEGIADLGRFIKTAQELGLYVIVRPSPYICAEWEMGGIPAWLLAKDGMHLRSLNKPFMDEIEKYYKVLFKVLTPLQITHGGPIIMFQVENEYGAYGEDTGYLEKMRDIMIENGADVPLITSDGPWDDYLSCGRLPGTLQAANFGSKAEEQFAILKRYIGNDKPLMCMEFWVGWFDAWGDEKHHIGDVNEHTKDLDDILSMGSVNIYMVHGGTNFGFMNGSNYYDKLTPDVTSYDYDALITEDGVCTPKYEAFKQVISKYRKIPEVVLSTKIERKAYGKLAPIAVTGLFESLDEISEKKTGHYPLSMEKLGQSYGYTLYRADLKKENNIRSMRIVGGNDRAKVYLDGKEILTLYDRELLSEVKFNERKNGDKLDILMENMGRVNYGVMMEYQQKGIAGAVTMNLHQHFDWDMYTLPLDNVDGISFTKGYTQGLPAFFKFEFEGVSQKDGYFDTFLDLTGFGKGCVFLNGFNLGRFWEIGPQKRLYIPGPLIKEGKNTLIVFETEGKAADFVELCAEPGLEH